MPPLLMLRVLRTGIVQLFKQLVAFSLMSLPLLSFACTIGKTGNTVTLTVGKNKCLNTPEARKAFTSAITAALEQRGAGATPSGPRPLVSRSSAGDKLYNFADLRHQAEFLNNPSTPAPTYYGERR
jgi:hypothetical protein